MIKIEDLYKIGVLGKPHGIKGELTFMFDDDIFDRTDADYLFLEIDKIFVPFYIEEYRFRNETTALIKFCDIEDADSARSYTGCNVYFPKSMSDNDKREDMNWHDLCGYTIIDNNKTIGIIINVDESTENILFTVKSSNDSPILIPAADDLIKDINIKDKIITMELPEGLLNI